MVRPNDHFSELGELCFSVNHFGANPYGYSYRPSKTMLPDIYKTFRDDPGYKKLVGHDYLFLEYKCPLEAEIFQFTTELSFLTFVISGKKDWLIGDQVISVQEGDAVFIRKGNYTTRQYFEVDHCLLTFFISDDFIRTFLKENDLASTSSGKSNEHDRIFRLSVDQPLRTLFFSVYNYLRMASIPRALVELKFRELLFNIMLNPANAGLSRYFYSLNQAARWHFEDVMMKHFTADIELEEFARLSGRSLSTFKRDFKQFYNQSPGKWLNERRLEYARALLVTSDMNINEVCYESGFRNTSHFNSAFKERYKLPPGQFRENNAMARSGSDQIHNSKR